MEHPGFAAAAKPPALESRLRQAVVDLAFACLTGGAERDERVMLLATQLEERRADSEVPGLTVEVLELVLAQVRANRKPDSLGQLLAEFVDKLSLEDGYGDEARLLRRRFAASDSTEELAQLADELATLLNGVARLALAPVLGLDAPDDDPLDGLLGALNLSAAGEGAMAKLRERLRHRRDQQGREACARDAAQILNEELRAAARPGTSDAVTLKFVRDQLRHLLEQVVVPGRLATEIARIGKLLDAAGSEADIEKAVKAIGLVLGRRVKTAQKDAEELTRFMTAVTRRLTDFRAQVARDEEGAKAASANIAADFQRELSTKVADIRELVDEGAGFDDLKQVMLGQLESLEAGMMSFIEAEEMRRANARVGDAGVLSRVTELEDEVERLRQKLGEEHLQRLLDPLTSVYNRLGYNEGMGREHARWTRHGGTLSLLVLDLDRFKSINDGFGHAVGDKVLTYVATVLRQHSRKSDMVCRLGGEEFAVILPETNLAGAVVFAEKMREGIQVTDFRFKEQPVKVTVSVGVAEFHGPDSPELVFERADRALYLAKGSGRNRVCTENDIEELLPEGPPVTPMAPAQGAGDA